MITNAIDNSNATATTTTIDITGYTLEQLTALMAQAKARKQALAPSGNIKATIDATATATMKLIVALNKAADLSLIATVEECVSRVINYRLSEGLAQDYILERRKERESAILVRKPRVKIDAVVVDNDDTDDTDDDNDNDTDD